MTGFANLQLVDRRVFPCPPLFGLGTGALVLALQDCKCLCGWQPSAVGRHDFSS